MNRLSAVMCLALAITVSPVVLDVHAQGFEGTVTMRELTLEAEPLLERVGGDRDRLFALSVERLLEEAQEAEIDIVDYAVTYYMKGSMLRSTAPGMMDDAEGYMLVDYERGIYRLVQPDQQLYVEWSADPDDVPDAVSEDVIVDEELGVRIEPMRETRTINGLRCSGYRSSDESGTLAVAWLTTELEDLKASFVRLAQLSESMGDEEESDPVDRMLQYGFPVLTLSLEGEWAHELSVAELVSIERAPLSDDLFAPPAGFTKISLQEAMRRQIERR